jgi:hypothetical protein
MKLRWLSREILGSLNSPPTLKVQCEGLVCEHSQLFSRAQVGFGDFTEEERRQFAPVQQRLIRRHPSTGQKSLYLASHAGTIVGWPIPEARAFLRDLIEHATQRQLVYSHEWKQFDLVMWDNQATMHRSRPFDATDVSSAVNHRAAVFSDWAAKRYSRLLPHLVWGLNSVSWPRPNQQADRRQRRQPWHQRGHYVICRPTAGGFYLRRHNRS